jgi:hypothetical protein
MITKVCQFQANRDNGERLVQVFQPGQIDEAARFFSGMTKEASPLLPDVRTYLEKLKPHPRKIYVLVNALGAGEYWGSNINGDLFPEAGLIHEGLDYGYRTFYNAHTFKHHANKQPELSFGDIELAVWHDGMKRVELIIAVDRDRAAKFGAQDICDKLDKNMFPDVSMGTKVPYDLCSICTDWDKYYKAQATFNPSIHKTVGQAVLAFHAKNPIRGLSPRKNDYCDHLRHMLNKILSDGRRVCMINDYPRFFDISFVFIGADKTAKVMLKLAMPTEVIPSWAVAEMLGYQQVEVEKTFEKTAQAVSPLRAAALIGREAGEELLEMYSMGRLKVPEKYSPKNLISGVKKPQIPPPPKAEEKIAGVESVRSFLREKQAAKRKRAEITKDVTPQFGGRAMPLQTSPDLPNEVLDQLGSSPLTEALSTPSHMGMLLRPREFQRIIIIRMGNKPLADDLDRSKGLFPPSDSVDPLLGFGQQDFSSRIMKMLLPFLEDRSHFDPVIKRQIIQVSTRPSIKERVDEDSDPHYIKGDPLLDKISSAYNSYLDSMIKCAFAAESIVEHNSDLWAGVYGVDLASGFTKEAEISGEAKAILGAIGGAYLLSAYAKSRIRKSEAGHEPPPGVIMQVLADHPHIAAALAGMGAARAVGSEVPGKLVSTGVSVVKRAIELISGTR